jgi:hypothetical protein
MHAEAVFVKDVRMMLTRSVGMSSEVSNKVTQGGRVSAWHHPDQPGSSDDVRFPGQTGTGW